MPDEMDLVTFIVNLRHVLDKKLRPLFNAPEAGNLWNEEVDPALRKLLLDDFERPTRSRVVRPSVDQDDGMSKRGGIHSSWDVSGTP